MKTITQTAPMIFSRLERARIEHEIRVAVLTTYAWWCATVALVIVAALIASRLWP